MPKMRPYDPPPDAKPWERQKDETVKAFEAFMLYRDLGPKRSQPRLVSDHGFGRRSVEQWSSKHGWVARVQAWDDYQDEVRREAMLAAIREAAERHITDSMDVQKALTKPVRILLEKLEKMSDADLHALPVDELYRITVAVSKVLPGIVNIERVAREMAASQNALAQMGPDGAPMPSAVSFDEDASQAAAFVEKLREAQKLPPAK